MNILSTAQAARELGVSVVRVRTLIASGRLKATRIGARSWCIEPKHLDAVRVRKPGHIADRTGLGTGVFAFGAPRSLEFGLKVTF